MGLYEGGPSPQRHLCANGESQAALSRSTHENRALPGGVVHYVGIDDFAGGERVADCAGGAAAHLSADAWQTQDGGLLSVRLRLCIVGATAFSTLAARYYQFALYRNDRAHDADFAGNDDGLFSHREYFGE